MTLFFGCPEESMTCILTSFLITLVHIRPVDDIEEGLHVICTEVLVLKVVSMLPDIKTEQWNQACNASNTVQ